MWFAYYQIEPFGGLKDDFRAGQICATAANLMGAGGKKELVATDFIPTYDSILQAEADASVEKMNQKIATSFQTIKNLAVTKKRVNK